ncbi:MAG TPA: hypothetical protein VFZ66_04160 [Herpetosiphonaceae bacterium]
MSDKPLFQNTDEQEAIYAPEQLPEGSAQKTAAEVEARDSANAVGGGVVPVPAAGVMGAGVAGGASGTGTPTGGAAPAVGAAALANETEATNTDDRS